MLYWDHYFLDISQEGSQLRNPSDFSSDETVDGNDTNVSTTASICIGDKEKEIATSKLTSLISSLLDKNEERSISLSSKKTGDKGSTEKMPKKMAVPEIPAFGSSPANFSFLSDLIKVEPAQSEVCSSLERCHSTSTLNDIKKTHSRIVSESSEISSLASSLQQKESSSSDSDQNVVPPPEDESSKTKYRRCSSLKSGKTPPGTPGRQKIVR